MGLSNEKRAELRDGVLRRIVDMNYKINQLTSQLDLDISLVMMKDAIKTCELLSSCLASMDTDISTLITIIDIVDD